MDYVPWPENGCSLAEARERTADRQLWKRRDELLSQRDGDTQDANNAQLETSIRAVEEEASTECLDQLKDIRLIAYGRPNSPTARPELISSASWRALNKAQWESSAATEEGPSRRSFFDIRVYPPLLAPCRLDILTGLPIIEAFKRFVLGDPEVAALGREAIRLSPDFKRVFVQGYCHVRGVEEWPLAFERWSIDTTVHPDPAKRSVFDDPRNPDPIEVVIAAEARIHRYQVLVSLVCAGDLEGRGLPGTDGPPENILRSIWSHEDFFFDPTTGNILQDNPKSTDRYDRYIKRWIGVVLQRTASTHSEVGASTDRRIQRQPSRENFSTHAPGEPPELPFTTAEVLAAGSLSEALTRLVFRHPDVKSLCRRAIAVADKQGVLFVENAGLVANVYGHEEALLPLRFFGKDRELTEEEQQAISEDEDAEVAQYFDRPLPPEIRTYYDAVFLRARTLIEMLQNEEVDTLGHTVDGHLIRIAHTIWAHEGYYVHPPTGDIYEATPKRMAKRWTGVILKPGHAAQAEPRFHVEHTEPYRLPSATLEPQQSERRRLKGIARVETKIAAKTACRAWLSELFAATPDERTHTNDELWRMAQEKWPKRLSARAFSVARQEAITATGASAWALGGAPKKSQRRNRRTN